MDDYKADIIVDNINRIKRIQSWSIVQNIVAGKIIPGEKYSAIIEENALCFIIPDRLHRRNSLYFMGLDHESAISILRRVKGEDIVCDYMSRDNDDPLGDLLSKAGFRHFSTYLRVSNSYRENPFLIPEKGKRKILQEMYEPDRCCYAKESDIKELMKINESAFITYVDDFFTYEEWVEIINKRECLIYKENDKIISFYVWKIEGKKLYANMIVNYGTADLSYNMERRAFEEAWEKGVRSLYYWIRVDNKKALSHNGIDIKGNDAAINGLYDYIYCLNSAEREQI